jgi:hypothetical protein
VTRGLGIIPDIIISNRLIDVKTFVSKRWYTPEKIQAAAANGLEGGDYGPRKRHGNRKRSRDQDTVLPNNHLSPVEERARHVHGEYIASAEAKDKEYNEWDGEPENGPMMETITSYEGKVLGFAFGAIGEASSGVYAHACACAQAISEHARQAGDIDAATEDGTKGKALTAIVRDWGVTNTKQRAQCLITLASKTIPNVGAKYYRASKDDYEELCKRTDAATRANRLDHAARLRPAGAPWACSQQKFI